LMQKRPFHSLWFLRLAAVLVLIALAFGLPKPSAFALSLEEETQMGQEFVAQIKRHFNLAGDDFANQFINDLGHYLIRPLEVTYFPFRFYIIKDNTLNAFAGPGGHIFIFSGLIDVMDGIDELSAVISHEIGHISARHLAHRIEQGKKIGIGTMAGILAGVLLGGGPLAGALITGSMAAGLQAQLHYSRSDERQADQLGYKYMTAAGFDPAGMITTLRKIERGSLLGTDKMPPYLMTHPSGPERMSNLDTMLSQYSPGPAPKEAAYFSALFPFFKTTVLAISLDPNEAEERFKGTLKKGPDSYLSHYGLGVVFLKKLEYPLAIHHLKKALEEKPGFVPILTKLGEAYQKNGQDDKALSLLEEAVKLNDRDRTALFHLGLCYERSGAYQKAIHLYERVASFHPVKPELYYHLGLCYGKQGRLALAHYNLGLYSQVLGQKEKARFHFQKAEELSGRDPRLRKKIHEAMEPLS